MALDHTKKWGVSSEWRNITKARNIKRDPASTHERVGRPQLVRISTINTVVDSCAFGSQAQTAKNAGRFIITKSSHYKGQPSGHEKLFLHLAMRPKSPQTIPGCVTFTGPIG